MSGAARTAGVAPTNPWIVAPVVAIAAFMEVLDISVANVALPHIAGDLSVSQDQSTWTLTSYLVTNAIVMPISGWLAARFGRRRVFLICIAGFTLASLLCGLAPSLGTLVVLRAIQGAAGGGLQPTGQAILTDAFPASQRGIATAIYAVAVVFAPAIGPEVGGWITDNYDWRWVFLINVPVGAVLLFVIGSLIHTPHDGPQPGADKARVDWFGFGFIALGLGCLQIVLDRGQQEDWFASHSIAILTVVSAIALVLLVWWELRADNPMVDLRLFRHRDFAVAFALMSMVGFMIFGTTYLIPTYAQSLLGYQATQAGEALMPGGLILVLLFPLIGQAVNKIDLRILLFVGLAGTSAALWWMTGLYLGVSFGLLALGRLLQSVGFAFLFLPCNALAFRDLPPDRTSYASALINLARNFGGSIGISLASIVVLRREQFHQSRMVEHLQGLNAAYPEYLQKLGAATHTAVGSVSAIAHVFKAATQQAMLLGYLDAFKLFAVIFLLITPLLLLVRGGTASGGAPAH